MPKYQLILGIQKTAVRAFVYGPEGIGKSTLAAKMPDPIFIDIESGTNQLPVARMPRPTSWAMLKSEVQAVRDGDVPSCRTLVIDTADAAETLCISSVCAEQSVDGIEKIGYGRGYVFVREEWGRFLDLLSEVAERGINIMLLGHSRLTKFERPDESGAYDRYEPKLIDSKRASVSDATKEWADMVLFLDYKVYVEEDNGKAKATGGKRVVHTTHHVCWDAKNRFGLPDEMPLNDATVSAIYDLMLVDSLQASSTTQKPTTSETLKQVDEAIARMVSDVEKANPQAEPEPVDERDMYPPRLKALADLMRADEITDEDLRRAMAAKGYVPFETPVANYQQRLVDGVVASWANFVKFVHDQRQAIA